MNKIIENTNLNINTLLINWSLMNGYSHDDVIETTKFGCFNQWFGFLVCLFTAIKWSILLFSPQDSEMSKIVLKI